MFKIFAVLCVLVYPDDTMSSKMECTTYYEDINRTFRSEAICFEEAQAKLETTMRIFEESKFDYESIMTGCEKI
tara:strand:- start:352 stop:573 length:222 start_codon:yes stop_codon:yes gene_type:complete